MDLEQHKKRTFFEIARAENIKVLLTLANVEWLNLGILSIKDLALLKKGKVMPFEYTKQAILVSFLTFPKNTGFEIFQFHITKTDCILDSFIGI